MQEVTGVSTVNLYIYILNIYISNFSLDSFSGYDVMYGWHMMTSGLCGKKWLL